MTPEFPQEIARAIAADLDGLASTDELRRVRRAWSRELRQYGGDLVLAVATDLFERHGYRWVAYELVSAHPAAAALLDAALVEGLAGDLQSWSDVDQFGVLLAGPAWRNGRIADETVHGWAGRADRWWRRAALVATVPLNVRSRGGKGDVPRTLAVCDLLIGDRDAMVEKGLSWALRELAVHDSAALAAYLRANEPRLGARVKREVANKLRTGLKAPSRRADDRATGTGKTVDSPVRGLL